MIDSLAAALPHAEFVEDHSLVIAVPPDAVWDALHQTRWSDLRWTRIFMLARGLGLPGGQGESRRLLDHGPVVVVCTRERSYVAGGRIAKPWKAVPEMGPPIASLDQLGEYDEPGWLKFGMDFTLHTLPGGRTRLATSTLCEPTDAEATRRFRRYWSVIRPFSGLIRRDMLHAIARRATAPAAAPVA